MTNRAIFWVIILVIGIGLIVFAQVFRDKPSNTFLNPTVSESPIPTASPTQSPVPGGSVPVSRAAICQISGSIKFINSNLYETIGAKISYKNVDDKIRQIFWKVSPDDGVLSVGPNLFEQLVLPSGEKEVGVALNKESSVNIYTLTASINYGLRNQKGEIEEKIANCTGTITVDTSKI